MKKTKELDVDFIGGQEPLTKEEEKALSDYFQAKKAKKSHQIVKKSSKRKKAAA